MASKQRIKLILIKSVYGRLPSHKACIYGLGLRKIGQCVVLDKTPEIQGMINKVSYALQIEET
jgi:large subunit ribosomal protein L30